MNDPKQRSWQCPYCQHFATIREGDIQEDRKHITVSKETNLYYLFTAITCLNVQCRKLSVSLKIYENAIINEEALSLARDFISPEMSMERKSIYNWRLLPSSTAKIFPEYIPQTIREDYEESCKIVKLSPKASATLSRRCLQTIIRDFWEIKNKSTLWEEIKALSMMPDIDKQLIYAFHDLRQIGNIGAHMDQDVNLIIEVTPDEAEELITFIENLIALTYIQKHSREENFQKLKEINPKNRSVNDSTV